MPKTDLVSVKYVLVADDDPAILDSTQLLLEELGYRVKTTVNGDTVRDMREDLPDILLLDIWMSGWDGRDICRHLKRQAQTSHIPIIIISANRDVAAMAAE